MAEPVYSEVAAFAHCLDVVWVFAEWLALAEVCHGEEDVSARADGFVPVFFGASFVEVWRVV